MVWALGPMENSKININLTSTFRRLRISRRGKTTQTNVYAQSLQLRPTLCAPVDCSPPGSSVPGILQARTLEGAAISFSNACMHTKSLQSCLTPCDPMDSSPPGSSVHRILLARILEWVAISFSQKMMREN